MNDTPALKPIFDEEVRKLRRYVGADGYISTDELEQALVDFLADDGVKLP